LKSQVAPLSKLRTSLASKTTNERLREHWRWNLKAKNNPTVQKRQRIKETMKVPIISKTVESMDKTLSTSASLTTAPITTAYISPNDSDTSL
jgi:hypothetical protein